MFRTALSIAVVPCVAITLILSAALAVPAQPAAGDYIVVHTAGTAGPTLLAVDRSGKATTVAVAPANHLVVEPRMDVGNLDLVVNFNSRLSAAGALVRITPAGKVTTIASASSFAFSRATEVDADGSYLLFDSLAVLHRVAGGSISTVTTFPRPFGSFNMTIDPTTGYYWMADFGGRIAWVHHQTSVITTLFPGQTFRYVTGMDHDETTDTFAFCNETLQRVFFVNRQMQVVKSFGTPAQNWSLRLAPDTGNVHILDGNSTVIEWSPAGKAVRTTKMPVRVDFFSLEVYGSRPVSGTGSAVRTTVYDLWIGFPGLPGLPYAAALSLGGIRPGIPFPGGRRLALAADALFLLTAEHGDIPGITKGLRGTLSATGQAKVSISIPRWMPPFTRIFASAVALDPTAPGGLHIGNVWSFETR